MAESTVILVWGMYRAVPVAREETEHRYTWRYLSLILDNEHTAQVQYYCSCSHSQRSESNLAVTANKRA